MTNTTALLIKVSLLFVLTVSFSACNLPKEKFYHIENANKSWLYTGAVGSSISLTDTNGISESFTLNWGTHEFSEGYSGYLFITTRISKRESFHQNFSSTYGHRLSLTLSANYPPFGDELYVSLNDIGFAYDLKYNEITRLDTPFGYKSKTMTDTGYAGNVIIGSDVEILNQYELIGFIYAEAMKFTLADFQENWTGFTVREIYIAKKYGLVKYVYNNGIEVVRYMK